MRHQLWLRRAGVVLAVGLPWLLLLVPRPHGRPSEDGRERDLIRVYAELHDQPNYEEFADWCGLRVTRLTDQEMAAVAAALRDAKEEWLCRPYGESMPVDWVRDRPMDQLKKEKWLRIHHRTEPDQWIAVQIAEAGSTGRPNLQLFLVRVPIGFQPPPPPAALKG